MVDFDEPVVSDSRPPELEEERYRRYRMMPFSVAFHLRKKEQTLP